MWRVVLIGTAGTVIAIPVWLGLYSAMGVEGFALASTLVMTAYALALLVAWGLDSGWSQVRAIVPSILRGLVAAGLAAAVACDSFHWVWNRLRRPVGGRRRRRHRRANHHRRVPGVSYLLRAPEPVT